MIASQPSVETVSFYINGQWESAGNRKLAPVTNPATGAEIAQVAYATAEDVDRTVRAAHAAYLKWRDVPVVDRMQPLYRYKMLLEKNHHELASTLTTENGKTIDDARAEVRRAIQMVEVACGMPSLMMGDSLNDVSAGIDSHTIRQPLGVCAGITPFNFPAMVPMWMWPFAIAAGNAFILKPSEKVPMTPTLAAKLLHEAGLPAGVFNLIHGDKVAVDALLRHPLVRAVSFVGSTPVAKYIYKTAAEEGKRVQALGGAKNHLVVMPDAHLPKTVENIISSAFGAAGERCLAGSVLVPVGDAAEPLLKLLIEKVNEMRVGDGGEEGVGMGPLVTKEHRDRVAGYIEKGVAEGAKPLLDGRTSKPKGNGFFLGPTIFDGVQPEMTIAKDEIFGPVLSVIRVKTLEEAIELVNRSPFGNATSIFTGSGKAAREYSARVEAGMVGINVGVAAPMAFFPFAGWKNSFFGDLHAHGKDAVMFYTEQKVLMTRWF
ncbi:MAG: CoA-acylating methylmalonate-semialdehyde dehydrogenase [Bryobacteraceae bacterium]|jgi:malonate-semialdehyde dehydrogenase (acetylating)/methylmalonate-semialdehyde dehydrogenase